MRSLIDIAPDRHVVMDAWIFADGIIVLASLASAWALERQTTWVVPMVAFTAGCVVYPTVFLIGWVSFTEVGAGSLLTMVPPSIITGWIAYPRVARPAIEARAAGRRPLASRRACSSVVRAGDS